MHVSGMIQGCVRDVSGTSYGIEYVIIGIYMQYGSKCQRDACHARVRDISWMCQGCVRDELWMHGGMHAWADLTCGFVRCKLDSIFYLLSLFVCYAICSR